MERQCHNPMVPFATHRIPATLGSDSFAYTVADTSGRISNASTVNVNIVLSNLQNPRDFMDVNASGEVTSLDALLVMNRLSRAGNVANISVESTDRGPNFYDVSGDLSISSIDALRVINYLSRQQTGAGQAEAPVELSANRASVSVMPSDEDRRVEIARSKSGCDGPHLV